MVEPVGPIISAAHIHMQINTGISTMKWLNLACLSKQHSVRSIGPLQIAQLVPVHRPHAFPAQDSKRVMTNALTWWLVAQVRCLCEVCDHETVSISYLPTIESGFMRNNPAGGGQEAKERVLSWGGAQRARLAVTQRRCTQFDWNIIYNVDWNNVVTDARSEEYSTWFWNQANMGQIKLVIYDSSCSRTLLEWTISDV